jgi:RNase P/RNase MRP subunit p29
MEDRQERLVKVELKEVGEITLPSIDVSKYVGRKVKIASADTYQGAYGYFLRVETEPLDTVEGGKNPIVIKASRIFGLQEDADGRVGWGKDTKLGAFLAKMNVSHFNKLPGKQVIVQTVTNARDKRDYLSFN